MAAPAELPIRLNLAPPLHARRQQRAVSKQAYTESATGTALPESPLLTHHSAVPSRTIRSAARAHTHNKQRSQLAGKWECTPDPRSSDRKGCQCQTVGRRGASQPDPASVPWPTYNRPNPLELLRIILGALRCENERASERKSESSPE